MAGFKGRFSINPNCREVCPPALCGGCSGCPDTAPCQMRVVFSGLTGCCADLNGVPVILSLIASAAGQCNYQGSFSGACVTQITYLRVLGPPYQQSLQICGAGPCCTWNITGGTSPPCAAGGSFSPANLSPGGAVLCGSAQTGASAVVTAVPADPRCRVCCGPDGCATFTDRFNRADGPPGSHWTVESGTWAIATDTLKCTAAGAIVGPSSPSGGVVVWVDIKGAPGDTVSVLVAHKDAANTFRADFTFGTGTNGKVVLVSRSGGIDTPFPGTTATVNILSDRWTRVRVCYEPGIAFGAGLWDGTFGYPVYVSVAGQTGPGDGWGLAGAAGDLFDDLSASQTGDNTPRNPCPECRALSNCLQCAKGALPEQIDVDLGAGGWITNTVSGCPTVPAWVCSAQTVCEDVSGVYTLTSYGPCAWAYCRVYPACAYQGYVFCCGGLAAPYTDLLLGSPCGPGEPPPCCHKANTGSIYCKLQFNLQVQIADDGKTCTWILTITLSAFGGAVASDGGGCPASLYPGALFERADYKGTIAVGGPNMGPWTLTKTSDDAGAYPKTCGGALPATITLSGV